MSHQSVRARRQGGGHSRSIVALVLGLALFFGVGCPDEKVERDPADLFLDKAVTAMWGKRDVATIHSARTLAVFRHSDQTFEIETLVKLPDRYREVRRAHGITEVHALLGEEAWASVDGAVVPLEATEQGRLRMQPWLFEISKLAPLKDRKRFVVRHAGEVKDAVLGTLVRLAVRPKESSDVEMRFDFDGVSHVLRRVELENEANDEILSLVLEDYRAVDGVQVAHRLISSKNGKLYAAETVREIAFNAAVDDAAFRKPVDLSRDRIHLKEKCVGGLMAIVEHRGDPTDIADSLEDLKEWITENGLDIAGPLVVTAIETAATVAADTRPDAPPIQLMVPVSMPPQGFKPKERPGFALRTLPERPVLCITCVGASGGEAEAQLRARAKADGRKVSGPVLEVRFSPDGGTRQLQLPVE